MPTDAVIIDDGGSTRIKQQNRTLDDLLNGTDSTANPFTTCQLSIVNIDADGVATQADLVTSGGASTPTPIPFNKGEAVVITSGDQKTTITFDRINSRLQIDLTPSASTGPKPIVEARQAGSGQRRYIVSNAGAISEVLYNPNTGPNKTFTPPPGATYTMVRLG